MKAILISLLIAVIKCVKYSKVVTYVDWLSAQWGSAAIGAALDVPNYPQYQTPYNVVNLAFVVGYGFADAAAIWMNPRQYMNYNDFTFGTTNAEVQINLRTKYNDAGVKVVLSAFGDSWMPTNSNPNTTCERLANYVKDNHLDGLDLDYEDNAAMNKGIAEWWLVNCTNKIREILPVGQYILTHAPQAPYFIGYRVYPNGGYELVHKEVGDKIDWQIIETRYDTYEGLFIDAAEGPWNGTAIKQIHELHNVPYHKLVIGKPVTQQDATNTGYVRPEDLHEWGIQAYNELGWDAGFMDWQYLSDIQKTQGTFMTTVVGYSDPTQSEAEVEEIEI